MNIENQTFYGRKKEIHLLFDAWQHTLDGKPQWVTFAAETGTGKTRLIHEFYRYISDRSYRQQKERDNEEKERYQEDYDPSNYWPDHLPMAWNNLGLNPDSFSTSGTEIESLKDIPWLWWGIRGDNSERRNGSENGCAARDALNRLEVHATVLALRKERFSANIAALQQIGKWAAPKLPVVGPMLEIALTIGELVQAGRRPFETLLKGYGIDVNEERKKLQIKLQDLLVDSIMKFLEQEVPVVLVLDDVHWFDSDSIAFVERLVARVGEQSLPLMIISTCWAKEWTTSPVRETFLNFAGTALEESIGGVETEHIGSFLRSNLPGLSDEDQHLLARRANCNFRYATELVLALKRDPATFFEDETVASCLSTNGRDEIASKNLAMDQLVEGRFLDLDKTIQKALMRSSYQGARFDPKLTSLVTQAVDQEGDCEKLTMDAISQAERPGAMVCPVEADLWEFLQGPYWQLIRKRQEKGKDFAKIQDAYRHIVMNGNARVADSIIESLVLEWLQREQNMTQKVYLRAWLLESAVKSRRYQAALYQLKQLASVEVEAGHGTDATDVFSTLSLTASLAALQVFNQYTLSAGNEENRHAIEKLCSSLCAVLEAPIIRYRETQILPEGYSLPDLIEWCETLVSFRKGMGDMPGYVLWLQYGCEMQEAQLACGLPTPAMRRRYVVTVATLAQAHAPLAQNKRDWDQVFGTFMKAPSQLAMLEKPEQSILWAWIQLSILYFGHAGRAHYPEVSDWGNDWQNYCRAADKLGDVLADIEYETSAGTASAMDEFDDGLKEVLLHATTLTVEYSDSTGYALAIDFMLRLGEVSRAVTTAIFERIQAGGHVPISLANAAMEADLAVGTVLKKHSPELRTGAEPDLPLSSGIRVVRLQERDVDPSVSLKLMQGIAAAVDRYRELGVLSIEMIRTFAHSSYEKLALTTADASEAAEVFNRMLADAILIKDGERAKHGESVLLLPWLVRIFDGWLAKCPDGDKLWQSLREGYSAGGGPRFDTLVDKIRSFHRSQRG